MASTTNNSMATGNSGAGQKGRRVSDRRLDFSVPPVSIRIEVGQDPNKEIFFVTKTILVYHSPYFDGALNTLLNGAFSTSVVLPEVEATIFSILLIYMTTGRITHPSRDYVALLEFAKLWTLADYFLMPKLQNLCIDSMLISSDISRELEATGNTVMSKMDRARDVIQHAFQSMNDTPLRRLCVAKLLHMITRVTHDLDLAHEMINHCLQDTPARGVLHLLLGNLWKHRQEIMDSVELREENYYVTEN